MCWRWSGPDLFLHVQLLCVYVTQGIGRRRKQVKGKNRLLCCNKNTWIYSSLFQCWTQFCYIVREETPSADVGRVLIIGELHRIWTTGGVVEGLLQRYLHFTLHISSFAVNLHMSRRWKQNIEPQAAASTFRRRAQRKQTLWLQSALLLTYVHVVFSHYESKCRYLEPSFNDSLEWLETNMCNLILAPSHRFVSILLQKPHV